MAREKKIVRLVREDAEILGYHSSRLEGQDEFLFHKFSENYGLVYLGSATAEIKKKKVVYTFMDNEYNSVAELVDAFEKYNMTLPYPSQCYDPMYRNAAKVEMKVDYYLSEVLGLEGCIDNGKSIYLLKNPYKVELIKIQVDLSDKDNDNGSFKGEIIRSMGFSAYRSVVFSTEKEFIDGVNSIVASEMLCTATMTVKVLDNRLGTTKFDNVEFTQIDMSTFKTYVTNEKEHLIQLLEDALNTLKS